LITDRDRVVCFSRLSRSGIAWYALIAIRIPNTGSRNIAEQSVVGSSWVIGGA
jgi:hypothetical protein